MSDTTTATKEATEEKFLTLAEVVEYTGRSRVWLLKDENKEALIKGGSQLGGRGQSSKIPLSLIDELGWKKANRRSATSASSSSSSSPLTSSLAAEIARLEEEWADAKEKAGSLGGVIKQKRAELARIEKSSQREAAKAARKALKEEQKALAKAREEFEARQARVAELAKVAGE